MRTNNLAGFDKLKQKAYNFIDFLSDNTILIVSLVGIGISLFDFFFDLDKKLGKNYLNIILLMVSLLAVSLWQWRRKSDVYKKRLNDRLDKIAKNSDALDLMLSLSEPGLSYAMESLRLHEDINRILKLVNSGAKIIFEEMLQENSFKFRALASGDLAVSMWEAPKVNSRLIELFRERMDAVSDRDLSFFGEDGLGQRYYEKSVESRGRIGQRMSITRIFIVYLDDLLDERSQDLLVKTLEKHLRHGVGFGLAIYEDVKAIYDDFDELEINDQVRDQLRFDFALFNKKDVASFFIKDDRMPFFRAVFSTEDNLHWNNLLIENQRKLYKRLICDCWLVSDKFKELVVGGLYPDEWAYVENKVSIYNKRIVEKSKHYMEDDMFPLFIQTSSSIETDYIRSKVKQTYDLRVAVNGRPAPRMF